MSCVSCKLFSGVDFGFLLFLRIKKSKIFNDFTKFSFFVFINFFNFLFLF